MTLCENRDGQFDETNRAGNTDVRDTRHGFGELSPLPFTARIAVKPMHLPATRDARSSTTIVFPTGGNITRSNQPRGG